MTADLSSDASHGAKVLNQYMSALSASLMMFGHGYAFGWGSPAMGLLQSDDTPLSDGPLTSEQISWIGTINCVGMSSYSAENVNEIQEKK